MSKLPTGEHAFVCCLHFDITSSLLTCLVFQTKAPCNCLYCFGYHAMCRDIACHLEPICHAQAALKDAESLNAVCFLLQGADEGVPSRQGS